VTPLFCTKINEIIQVGNGRYQDSAWVVSSSRSHRRLGWSYIKGTTPALPTLNRSPGLAVSLSKRAPTFMIGTPTPSACHVAHALFTHYPQHPKRSQSSPVNLILSPKRTMVDALTFHKSEYSAPNIFPPMSTESPPPGFHHNQANFKTPSATL